MLETEEPSFFYRFERHDFATVRQLHPVDGLRDGPSEIGFRPERLCSFKNDRASTDTRSLSIATVSRRDRENHADGPRGH